MSAAVTAELSSFPEHTALQVLVARLRPEPDGEERAGEVVTRNAPARLAVQRDLDARSGTPGERHRIPILHVRDERAELSDSILRGLVPHLPQLVGPTGHQAVAIDVAQELHGHALHLARVDDRVGVARTLLEVESAHVRLHAQN